MKTIARKQFADNPQNIQWYLITVHFLRDMGIDNPQSASEQIEYIFNQARIDKT